MFFLRFLVFLCFLGSVQPIDSSLQWPNSVSLQKRGFPRLRFWSSAGAGSKEKPRKAEENHDKNTGMFAYTFLTITSFPETRGHMLQRALVFENQQQFDDNPNLQIHGFGSRSKIKYFPGIGDIMIGF